MSAASCRTCAVPVRAGSRFCSQCGSPVGDRVPANVVRVEPRYFGVAPATLLLVVAAAAVIGGIALIVAGDVLAGAVLAAAAVPLAAAFVTLARRFPDSGLARGLIIALDRASSRGSYVVSLLSVRSKTRHRLSQARRELSALDGRRTSLLGALGAAVYDGDEGAAARLREQLSSVDERRAAVEAEMQTISMRAEERIEQARLEAADTQALASEPVVPEPVRVPEPYPPGELTPPEPPATPEPYPPPDEGSPPVPPVVPEPYPPGGSRA